MFFQKLLEHSHVWRADIVILLYHSLSLWQILVGTDLREQAKIAEDQSRSSGSRGIVIDIDCMALLID